MVGAGSNVGTSLWEQLMAGANWYYAENGQPVGPVSFESLRQMVGQGRVGVNDLVWREGEANWQAAGTVAGLVPPPSAQGEAVAGPQGYSDVRPNYYGPSGSMGMHYNGQRPVGPSQQGMAIAGFVLALTFPILGLIFSWVALSGMKKYHNDEGKGLATAGLIISVVLVGLGCLWVIGVVSCMGAGMHFRL
jgi:hypothetical protein